jgi:hypothetical protein
MAADANGLCPTVCVRRNTEQIVPDGIELIADIELELATGIARGP